MVSNTSENVDETGVPAVEDLDIANIDVPPASSDVDDFIDDDSEEDFAALLDE